ncbi:Hypothetical protein PHPALM_11395 [Phytophthora palmivora]|uniref:Uncharacterized protein n=1 Tax=Phytophthora palmivora TaxID=4796 RepID=A0A2P4Y2F3_9STRA|nr:Hypothetical protein PHPALM_11395 [Phytophthora palmivora]
MSVKKPAQGSPGRPWKKFEDKNIRVKLGDNQIVETKLEVVPIEIETSDLGEVNKCVAVVYATPDEFD